MDIMELGAIGELVGGAAVIVTLAYLAVQVRYARQQLRYQGETDLFSRVYDGWAPVYEGRNAEILWTGLNDPGALTDADSFVFDLLMRRHAGVLVETHRDLEAGMTSPEWAAWIGEHYRSVLVAKPGGRAWLRDNLQAQQGAAELLGPIE